MIIGRRGSDALPFVVLVAGGLLYLVNQIQGLSADWPERMHGNDFWHLYTSGLAIRAGVSPYDGEELRRLAAEAGIARLNPFVYPPFTGIMMVPFTVLAPQAALAVWFFLSHLLFFGALAFLGGAVSKDERRWTVALLLALGAMYFPLTRTLTAGQLNLILLFLLAGAVYGLARGHDRAGGILIGAATMVKVSPGLLILFLAWKRRWRAFIASLATAAALVLFSAVVLGPGYGLRSHGEAIAVFGQMSYGRSTWSEYGESFHVARANISPSSVIYRLLTQEARYAETADPGFVGVANAPEAAKALSVLIGVGLMVLVAWATRRGNGETFGVEFSLAAVAMLLEPSLFWDHYLTLLFVPFAFLAAAGLRGMPGPWVFLWVGAAVFVSRPYAFFDPRLFAGWETLELAPHLLAVLVIGGVLIGEIRRGTGKARTEP